MSATATTDGKNLLRSVSRALDVLQALGADNAKSMGVGEIAKAIGVSRSTAFTLLQTLVARGFVTDIRNGGARNYKLGLALVHLGDRAQADLGIMQIAQPIMKRLTEATQLTSRIAILDDGYAVAIGREESPGPLRLIASLGRREMPHCSSLGKIMLARLPTEQVMTLVTRFGMPERTAHTLTTPDALLRDLRKTMARGYALDNEEDNIGVVCIGAAIYDRSALAVAAISITCMKLDRGESDFHELGLTVRTHADQISLLLGGPEHADLPPLGFGNDDLPSGP